MVVLYCWRWYSIEEAAEKVRQGEARKGNYLQFVSGQDEPQHDRYRLEFRPTTEPPAHIPSVHTRVWPSLASHTGADHARGDT